MLKTFLKTTIAASALAAATLGQAAQLSTDARTAVPHEVQQLVVIDYRAMQNSAAAMDLRERVMPPELKQFDDALRKSGLNDNHDVDDLAFALFRPSPTSDGMLTVGIAQGQFDQQNILANFRKQKVKYTLVRTNKIYPLAKTGMVLCFVDASTMVFGSKDAVDKALDARDGVSPSLLTNGPMMDAMKTIDSEPLWSILDEKGTQSMMRPVSYTHLDVYKRQLVCSFLRHGQGHFQVGGPVVDPVDQVMMNIDHSFYSYEPGNLQ